MCKIISNYTNTDKHPLRKGACLNIALKLIAPLLLSSMIFWPTPARATTGAEDLVGTSCPSGSHQNAADYDTIAACSSTTFARQPFDLGSTADSCDVNHGGMMQWTGSAVEYCNGSTWIAFGAGTASTALSGLTVAAATNTFDNTTYAQTWTWNTITTTAGWTLTSSTATTGNILTLTNSNTAASTGAVLNVSTSTVGAGKGLLATASGASNTSYAGYFSNSSATGWGVYSAGTSPNYFAGTINLASGKVYQINGANVLSLPANDTTSIALGSAALNSQTGTSQYNAAAGALALQATTIGTSDTAVGYEAAYTNISGSAITAFGAQALYSATAGPNDAFGYQAGYNITTGTSNVALGDQAIYGSAAITGTDNTAAGYQALYNIQGGASNNTAIGAQALYTDSTASNLTAVGVQSLYYATASPNDAFGYEAGGQITTGTSNVAIGWYALNAGLALSYTTGNYNVAVGVDSLFYVTSGSGNTGVGALSGDGNQTGSYNTAIGYNGAASYTGSDATAFGYAALIQDQASTASDAFGYEAGYWMNTGVGNLAIGYTSCDGNIAGPALSGSYNTCLGYKALYSLQGAGNSNTALGYEAGYAGTAITTGSTDTFVGWEADSNNATYTNGTAIGNNAVLTGNSYFVLGNASVTALYAQVTSITTISDRRLKKDITDLTQDLGLSFIEKLKPVSYRFNNGDETERYGFIAQDLEKALPEHLQNIVESPKPEHGLALIERENNKDRTYRVGYGELTAPIVKAIQEQDTTINRDRDEVARLSHTSAPYLHAQMQDISSRLKTLNRASLVLPAVISFCGLVFGFLLGRGKMKRLK